MNETRLPWKQESYSADSRRWAGPGTSRGIWLHTLCSACLGERSPTAAPRIRSSRWVWWLSTPRSCAGWCRIWDRWEPEGFSYTHDFSGKGQRDGSAKYSRFSLLTFWKGFLTSSSLWRVLEVRAEVIPAFLEFWTKDWGTDRQKLHLVSEEHGGVPSFFRTITMNRWKNESFGDTFMLSSPTRVFQLWMNFLCRLLLILQKQRAANASYLGEEDLFMGQRGSSWFDYFFQHEPGRNWSFGEGNSP